MIYAKVIGEIRDPWPRPLHPTAGSNKFLGAEKKPVPANKPVMSHQGGPNIDIRNKFKYQIP
jgi:hypothetical protein